MRRRRGKTANPARQPWRRAITAIPARQPWRRGMTVVEVLVVSGIMLLLLGTVAAVLRPGLQAWRRGELRSDLQGNALLSMHALTKAIASSSSSAITVYPHDWVDDDTSKVFHDDALVLLSQSDEAPARASDGTAELDSVVIYFVKREERELWMATVPKGEQDVLPPAVVLSLRRGDGVAPDLGKQRRVGRYLRSLRIADPAGTYTVSLETAMSDYVCTLETAVTPALESFGGQSRTAVSK